MATKTEMDSDINLRVPSSPSATQGKSREAFPPSVRARRATIACTRCRRHRSKCRHDNAKAPCLGCREAGRAVAETCRFVGRGGKEITRAATNTDASSNDHEISPRDHPLDISIEEPQESKDVFEVLPPHEEVVEACKVFMNCYFQLGFLPKVTFLDQLKTDKDSISTFLLLCILSVSARFTPSLVARFGGRTNCMRTFIKRAESLAPIEIYKPTLESVQGFILLGSAEWANGDRNRSMIHLGVASTMVGMLGLHREETYSLPDSAKPEEIIYAEMARRTLWVMGMQRNLFSGGKSPVPFSLNDITALLPCEESEFAFGINPTSRAALAGSKAALDYPELVNCSSRSLFATLIQAHSLWGRVARSACLDEHKPNAAVVNLWESTSEYSRLSNDLNQWEVGLCKSHRWSEWYLRIYKTENLDLAYISIFMALRLSNIVLRRTHLEEIKAAVVSSRTPARFWENMSHDLFANVISLQEGMEAYLAQRPTIEGFPPLLAFCVYIVGSLASHLWKCPQLCPRLASKAEIILEWSLLVLVELQDAWPMAARWHQALQVATEGLKPLHQVSLTPSPKQAAPESTHCGMGLDGSKVKLQALLEENPYRSRQSIEVHSKIGVSASGEDVSFQNQQGDSLGNLAGQFHMGAQPLALDPGFIPFDSFEAELASYLQGDVHFGMSNAWTPEKNFDFNDFSST